MADRFARDLEHHLPEWVGQGLVSEEQAEALRQRHAPTPTDREHRTVRALSWIGAVLVAVGLVLFVATNWQRIPDLLRVLMLVALSAGAFAGGAWMLERRHVATGHGLLLLGGVAYGGTLMQIANSFQLQAHFATLVALWILGLLPVAYAFRSHAVHLLAVLLVPLWVVQAFLMDGDIRNVRTGASTFMATGVLLIGTGLLHPRRDGGRIPPFQDVHLVAGSLLVFLPAFVLTFFDRLPGIGEPKAFTAGLLVLWGAAVVALVAGAFHQSRQRPQPWLWGALALSPLLWTVVLFASPLVLDLAFAAVVIAFVVLAVQARHELLLNLGLALFVVEVFGRYIEFVFDLANPYLFFLVGGLLLMALAYGLERLRRRLARQIRAEAA